MITILKEVTLLLVRGKGIHSNSLFDCTQKYLKSITSDLIICDQNSVAYRTVQATVVTTTKPHTRTQFVNTKNKNYR